MLMEGGPSENYVSFAFLKFYSSVTYGAVRYCYSYYQHKESVIKDNRLTHKV